MLFDIYTGEYDMTEKMENLVIPVNKSAGLSTYDVIRRFKKTIKPTRVGHSGTLDPAATGLVLLLTGAATKLSGYLMDLPKSYVADIMLGISTDTQDGEGKVVRSADVGHITPDHIEDVLKQFIGRRMQTPPMYSALKHEGLPLYVYARRGQDVERLPREVDTYDISLVKCSLPEFTIEIHCSRGMYVRTLAEEIGDALSVPAYLSGLVRTGIGHFNLESSIADSDFENLEGMENPGYSLSDALSHLQSVTLSRKQARELEDGIAPSVTGTLPATGTCVRLIRDEGSLGAIAEVGPAGIIILRKVFPSGAISRFRDAG
ncbi:MAG: tRNA pseudouridine(55) synthase TruB [Candidatus Krumholzibacteriota bacterium]|nr:tRNA pseudouridine(55) synthase TruB [Candidatus Krumholzibacteriota bacterium]